MLQHPTVCPRRTAEKHQSIKAPKRQNIKTVKQQNENENENEKRLILTYNRTDINGRDVEKL
jgi:hypothetical protein